MRARILPVIDLKRGQVVQGVAGNRDEYQPVQSQLVDSPHPGRVTRAICSAVDSRDIYVADLDAIGGQAPDWNSYSTILNQKVEPWIDAGTGDTSAIASLLARVSCRVIVALESLPSLRSLRPILDAVPGGKLTFSLDMKGKFPMTKDPEASKLSAETIASYAVDAGVTSLILLDVAAVGTSGGATTLERCCKIKSRFPDLELVAGGGVRGMRDVERFVEAGCERVLVATAIHRGRI